MRKKVIRTAIGLTTLAAVGAGGYAYTNPEIIPNKLKKTLKKYGLFEETSSTLKVELPKLKLSSVFFIISKTFLFYLASIQQPINDDSLLPKSFKPSSLTSPAVAPLSSSIESTETNQNEKKTFEHEQVARMFF